MENDLVPFRRLVLLIASLAIVACALVPTLASAAPPSANPTALTFIKETVGKTSPPQTVTISNPFPGTSQVLGVQVLGTDPGDFSVVGETCAGATLAQGDSCTVEVAFAPAAGGPRAALLALEFEGEGPIAVPLAGIGQTMKLAVQGTAGFAATSVGATSSVKIPLKNESEAGVNVSELKFEGADANDFGIEGGACAVLVSPSMGCEVTVRFSPGAAGPREALLRISTDGTPGDYVVELDGEGVASELAFEPGQYDFGLVEMHSNSPRTNLNLRNVGAASVQLSNLQITGPAANEFWIPNSSCWGTALPPGATCGIEVQFNANEEGSFAAALSVDVGATTFQAPLTARAARPRVEASPAPLAFGPVTVGSRQVKEVTLTNTGSLPVAFYIALVSGGDIGSFHFVEESCTSSVFAGHPRIFEPGESCVAKVAFEPTGGGAKAATLSFFGGGEGALQVPVEGTAVGPRASLMPSSRDFGPVAVGSFGPTQTFELRNESGEPQTISSATLAGPGLGEFQIRSDECSEATLDPGATCAVAVRFDPEATGPKTATLRLRGASGTSVAQLGGEGTEAAAAAIVERAATPHGRVVLDLTWRARPAAAGESIGRARCASTAPCVVKLSGLVSGQIATASGRRASVLGLPVKQLKIAPGKSAAITAALPSVFGRSAPGAKLQISLRWRTGSERGAVSRSLWLP